MMKLPIMLDAVFPAFIRPIFTALLGAVAASIAPAATLSFDAPLHAKPDDSSAVVGMLPAGTTITALVREELTALGVDTPPPGWVAVRQTVPASGYVRNRDFGKDFVMRPDSKVYADPAENAAVIATVGPADKVEILDPVGRFSKAAFNQQTVAYLNPVPPGSRGAVSIVPSGPASSAAGSPPSSSTPVAASKPTPPPPEASVAPAAPEKKDSTTPVLNNATPRTFQGYLLRTRRFLGHGPKLDYQLVDENNNRIALLDISALLLTDPIEYFEGRQVTVYGPGMTAPDISDVIIHVETLRLAK